MKIRTSKGSKRPKRISSGRPLKLNAMSMQSKRTRAAYESREMPQPDPLAGRKEDSKKSLEAFQSALKPIRMGNKP